MTVSPGPSRETKKTGGRSTSATVVGLLGLLGTGCLGPNPLLDAGEDNSETATTGDGDAADTETGDGDTEPGDGDTETGDGDADGDCSNRVLDEGEADVDCGGNCEPCTDGSSCVEASDCESEVCTHNICQAPSCKDGVHNGTERASDCGGPCVMCEHSEFQPELDDFEGSSAVRPQVAMFADMSFAVTYGGPMQARARWFDEFGDPSGPDVEISDDVSFSPGEPIHFAAGAGDERPIHALVPGVDGASVSTDLFLIQREPDTELVKHLVNPPGNIVDEGDLSLDGSRATITWTEDSQVLVRRFDYDVGDGAWIDINPFSAETDPDNYKGSYPVMSLTVDGVVVVAWVRCAAMNGYPCTVAVRRFDTDWIDPAPIIVTETEEAYIYPQVALAEDGRAAVVWSRLDIGSAQVRARLLDADFALDGDQWTLQVDLPFASYADVAALSDGSFAFAWCDPPQSRIHLRRFVGPDMPKLPELGDESPWPNVSNPGAVSLSSVENRLAVVWSATVDMVTQVQGQVLSF
ncbi:hypothetical protein ENSA5_29330 [Enhygromyxa salina]|uniref:Uncharacterized protein n=2 Tax=Enhygromyxa salina TaxID=215803 RepID=A0A2S9Y1M2_9BACT|nr:hypothetical protein ENSA5_29330 [Enhygromyxa salina]